MLSVKGIIALQITYVCSCAVLISHINISKLTKFVYYILSNILSTKKELLFEKRDKY